MLRLTLAAIMAVSLIGCATVVSDTCPSLVDYTPEEQNQAADELESISPSSLIARMIGDYGVLREQVRACYEQ